MDQQINNLLQMMQSLWQSEPTPGTDGGPPVLALLQVFMPYFPEERQKEIGSMLQLFELQQSLANYANMAVNKQSPYSKDWRHFMLTSIRPHMPERKQMLIDLLIKIIEINEIMEAMDMQNGV